MTARAEVAPAGRPAELRATAGRAFGWSFLNTVVSRLGTLGVGIVLARLLGPSEFGTFAVATVALLAVLSFNELGVSLAIVRWREGPAHIAPTVTTISVGMSLLLFLLVCLTATPFAAAMGDPGAAGVVRLMAVAIVINGVVATPAALLQRDFRQGRRLVADQVNTWLGALVSLGLVLLGYGALSLAVGRIVGSAAAATFFLRWSPLPYRFGFDAEVARALLRFGVPLAGASVIVFAVGYADQIVAGSALGATALGVYVLAFNLSSWPVSIFSQPLRSVAPAVFARLQDDPAQMHRAFAEILRLVAAAGLPACLLLAGAAEPLVRLVYGERWSAAATALGLLGLLAAARILLELSYDLLVVKGRTRSILVVQVLWVVVLIPALLLGAREGSIRGIALAQAAVVLLFVVPAYAFLLHRSGVALRALLSSLWLAAVVSAVVGLVALLIARQVPSAGWASVTAGLVALLACCGLLFRSSHALELLRLLRRQESVR